MPDATLKSHSDAWTDQVAEHQNRGKGNRLHVRGPGSGHQRQVYLGFAKPFPHHDNIVVLQATLQLRLKDDWGGSHTLTAKRITHTWKEHRITWDNAPDTTDRNSSTENVTGASAGDLVEIDVTDILSDISLGDDWFGIYLELDDDVDRTFHASDSPNGAYHPKLYVQWGFAPYPPTDLSPGGGQVIGTGIPILNWAFRDIIQENTQAFSQVQLSSSSSFASPLYDSGKQANTVSNWSLVGEYGPIADGDTVYWRVRTWDDANRVSGWSDTYHFQRVAKGTLTFVNPGPSQTVDDLTPLISWNFTGTQERARLVLLEILPDKTTRQRWDSGAHKHTQPYMTIPSRNRKHPRIKRGHDYRLRLYVWDDEDRVSIPHDPAYAFAQIDFTYERDETPDPIDTLTAAISTQFAPAVLLTWTRASTPDWFAIAVNDEEVYHRIEPTDVSTVTPGQYQMLYWELEPGTSSEIEVEAVEQIGDHAKHSGSNPTATITTRPIGVWLIDDDYDEAVMMSGTDAPDTTVGESGTTYFLVGQRPPVRITDAIRGYEGSWSGTLRDDDDRDQLLEMKNRSKELRLVIGRWNIPVYLEEVSVAPMADEPALARDKYAVTIAFFQTDEFFDGNSDESY